MPFRQIIHGLLMLLMFTPSMVCVMAMCAHPAQAKSVPCHEEGGKADPAAGLPMLMGDCTQNDLNQAFSPDLPLPYFTALIFAFIAPLLFFTIAPAISSIFSGAGPPFRGRASYHRLLLTQRFRQ